MSIITIHARLCRGENSDAPPRQSHPLPVGPATVGWGVHGVSWLILHPSQCAPKPGSMSNSCPSLPKSPESDSWFDLQARSVRMRRIRGPAPSQAFTRCWRVPTQPRTVRSASGGSAASQHRHRQPLLELPFNQVCFLEPASTPRFYWRRKGGESRSDALLLDHMPVNQRQG